jgi:hypothetical protein
LGYGSVTGSNSGIWVSEKKVKNEINGGVVGNEGNQSGSKYRQHLPTGSLRGSWKQTKKRSGILEEIELYNILCYNPTR